MTKENIIKELVNDLEEFKPVAPASNTAILWASTSFVITISISFFVDDFRAGVQNQFLQYPRLSSEILLGIGIVVFLAMKVLALSIPGTKTKGINITLGILTIGFASLFAYSFFEPSAPSSMQGKREYCFFESLAYGFLLLGSILYLSKKRAPFQAVTIGALGGLAACSLTAVIMHAACMYNPLHVLENHLSPVLIMACVGALASKFFIKKV